MNDKWENKLSDKFNDFELPVSDSDDLWANIQPSIGSKSTGKRKIALWLAGIAASCLLIVSIGLFTLKQDNTHIPSHINILSNNTRQYNTIIAKTNISSPQNIIGRSHAPKHNISISDTAINISANVDTTNTEIEICDKSSNDTRRETIDSVFNSKPNDKNEYYAYSPSEEYIAKNNMPMISANLYIANNGGSSSISQGYSVVAARNFQSNSSDIVNQGAISDIVFANLNKEITTKKHHNVPIRFGANVRYNLSPRIGVESGITYSILSSQFTSGRENYYYESHQTLHYLGIPLLVNYNIAKFNNFSFYITGGGMVEKCVSGSLSTDYIVNGKFDSSDKANIKADRLQWSIKSAVGLQYNIYKKIALYAEPGINYYINNGENIETIYKDTPFNFDFKAGVRVILK